MVESFLKPDRAPMDYGQYKEWSNDVNSKGKQPTFDAVSDARLKRYVVDTISSDNILKKMIGLNFISNGIIDKNLAELYFLKEIING